MVESSRISGETILTLGIVAGGLYVLYQLVKGIKGAPAAIGQGVSALASELSTGAQQTADVVTSALAAPFTPRSGGVPPTGSVVLPNGQLLQVTDIVRSSRLLFDPQTNTGHFSYDGIDYAIDDSHLNTQGSYLAWALGPTNLDFGVQAGLW